MKIALCLTLGCLAACAAGEPVGPVSAPAPAGALECALRAAGEAGYSPTAGGVGDGYLTVTQLGRTYTVSVAQGVMRVVVNAGDRQADRDARAVLAACASPPPAQ
jgi:hypothetical protein